MKTVPMWLQFSNFCSVKCFKCSVFVWHLPFAGVEVSAGRGPRRCFRAFVGVLSAPQAHQTAFEPSTFEVSSQLTLSADSTALNGRLYGLNKGQD